MVKIWRLYVFAVSTGPWYGDRFTIKSFGSSNWKKEIIAEIKSKLASSQNASKRHSDTAICNLATENNYYGKSWRTYNHAKEYVEEAKLRVKWC